MSFAPRHRRLRTRTVGLLIGGIALAWLAWGTVESAVGQIVWSKGGEIWTMNDDGTGARTLVPLSATPGMVSLRSPGTDLSSGTVLFEGSTDANHITRTGLCGTLPFTYTCFTFHDGFNATGVYRWTAGTTQRLSAAPAYCWNCTDVFSDPVPRPNDSVVSTFTHCQGFVDEGSYDCVGAVQASSGEAYPSCDDVSQATPNPANPSQLVHTGCASGGNPALVVTGPNRSGERVVACDDTEQTGPSWSTDGSQIVAAEGGTEPGIWIYGAANTACFTGSLRYAVVTPPGTVADSPRFIGSSGRIVFEAGGELWTAAANCDHCAFPGAATQLTTGGNNHEPSWTSNPLTVPLTGTPPGGATPPGGTPAPGPTPDTTVPTLNAGKTPSTQRVGSKQHLTLTLTASEAATLTVTGTIKVAGKDPVLARTTAALAAGSRTTVRVKLGTKAMKALRREWAKRRTPVAKLQLALRDAAGNVSTVKRQVKLRK